MLSIHFLDLTFFVLASSSLSCQTLKIVLTFDFSPLISSRELYEPLEEEGLEPETIQLDPADLAGWNQEIFGKKKK